LIIFVGSGQAVHCGEESPVFAIADNEDITVVVGAAGIIGGGSVVVSAAEGKLVSVVQGNYFILADYNT
jgi:hypothetical protein